MTAFRASLLDLHERWHETRSTRYRHVREHAGDLVVSKDVRGYIVSGVIWLIAQLVGLVGDSDDPRGLAWRKLARVEY